MTKLYSFDEANNLVLLRGQFGRTYSLDASKEATSPFVHGDWVEDNRNNRIAVILGELSGRLWFQYTDEHTASSIPLPDAPSCFATITAKGDLEYEGPLGITYSFDTKELDEVFDVRSGAAHYLKIWDASVSFVGTFLKVPWVRILRGAPRSSRGLHCAVPLAGCKDADTLRSLFGLCDLPTGPNTPYVESPRTRMTPRTAAAQSAVRVVVPGQRALCTAPLGVTLDVDISAKSIKTFELSPSERLLVLHGVGAGRLATVIGVHTGILVVLIDGDSKVTVVRGCSNSAEVSTFFARPKGGASSSTPARSAPAADHSAPAAAAAASQIVREGRPTVAGAAKSTVGDANQSSSARPFRCWTAFGRLEFNASSSATKHFGEFLHGDTLRCTKGADSNKIFHVVGERNGVLWVIENNKLRATPLAHCTNANDVENMFGFTKIGHISLKVHDSREDEPPRTPFRSPGGEHINSDGNVNREGNGSSKKITPVIPPLIITRELAPQFEAVATTSSSLSKDVKQTAAAESIGVSAAAEPVVVASSSSPQPTTIVPQQSSLQVSTPGGSGQSSRNFLKAVAMFMLGTTNQNRTPLPFYEYYAVDPTKRIGAALKKLEGTRDAWARVHPSKPFQDATVEDLLRLFAKFPQLLP